MLNKNSNPSSFQMCVLEEFPCEHQLFFFQIHLNRPILHAIHQASTMERRSHGNTHPHLCGQPKCIRIT